VIAHRYNTRHRSRGTASCNYLAVRPGAHLNSDQSPLPEPLVCECVLFASVGIVSAQVRLVPSSSPRSLSLVEALPTAWVCLRIFWAWRCTSSSKEYQHPLRKNRVESDGDYVSCCTRVGIDVDLMSCLRLLKSNGCLNSITLWLQRQNVTVQPILTPHPLTSSPSRIRRPKCPSRLPPRA
jgi:hypothetical protein